MPVRAEGRLLEPRAWSLASRPRARPVPALLERAADLCDGWQASSTSLATRRNAMSRGTDGPTWRTLGDLGVVATLGVMTSSSRKPTSAAQSERLINVSDLPDRLGYISGAELEEREVPMTRKLERARTRHGDVVIVARGGGPKVGIVSPEAAGAVVSGSLMLLRPDNRLYRHELLAAWLASSKGEHDLLSLSRSSVAVLSLSTRDVLTLQVPVSSEFSMHGAARILAAGLSAYEAGVRAAELRRTVALRACQRTLLEPREERSA